MALGGLLNPGDWLAMKPRIEPTLSPFEYRFRPDPGEVRLRFWVGGVVLAAAAVAWFMMDDAVALAMAVVFGLFAVLNLAYAVTQSRFSYELTISSFEVTVKARTLFGARDWRERLSAYQGVLLREEEFTESSSSQSRIKTVKRYYIVELFHEDEAKRVPLYVVEGGPAPHAVQEAYGKRFNLPALTPDLEGVARAGRPARGADPGPPPPTVEFREIGDVVSLSLRSGRAGRVALIAFWLLLPVGLGSFLYQIDPEFGLLGGAMAFVFVALLLGLSWLMTRKKLPWGLCLSGRAVWIGPSDAPVPSRLAYQAVTRVRADRAQRGGYRLVIEGPNHRLESGGTAAHRSAIEWMRDYLLYRMARQRLG